MLDHNVIIPFSSIFRVTMTPWMQVLWMRRVSFTSCLGLMMLSTWPATGCLLEHWRRSENDHRGDDTKVFPTCLCGIVMYVYVCVLQSVLLHPAVGDCAVVGLEDALKGVVPLALCVLKNGEALQIYSVALTEVVTPCVSVFCHTCAVCLRCAEK